MIDALGGLSAAGTALREAGIAGAGSLKRFRRGDAPAPDDLMAAMRRMIAERPRWLMARDDKRRPWIVHNHAPAFSARIVDGDLRDVVWHAGQPPTRVHGILLKEARAHLATEK